jgi:asparagine synthase (glutamine-hydrolysing)
VAFCRSPFDLSPLELSSGLVFGNVPRRSRPSNGVDDDPTFALEEAIRPALERGPCFVSFSGGRDSSIVLAGAAALARREGLQPPIPVTNVFPDVPSSAEGQWQQLVVSHLGLEDWIRLELFDELDCVGSLARSIFERHGLLWPFNAHFHAPLLEIAGGATLLTGIGGDELLGTSHWARAAALLSGGRPRRARDVLRACVAVAPFALRRLVLRRRYPMDTRLPWLTDGANAELRRLAADDLAREPLRWSDRWRWWHDRRETGFGVRSLELIAEDRGARIEHPLTDRRFASSVARFAERRRLHDRTSVLRAAFSGLLPATLLERPSKAAFDSVFFGAESRARAVVAVDELEELDPVNRAALRATWSGSTPDPHSFLLLQAALVRQLEHREGHSTCTSGQL